MSQSLIEKNGKYYKEVEVVMLESKDKQNLTQGQIWTHNNGDGTKLRLWTNKTTIVKKEELQGYCIPQHLYFLSNEEIKEGDWCIMLDSFGNVFSNPQQYLGEEKGHYINKGTRKIIATTDSSLKTEYNQGGVWIEESLPQSSPEFIQVYVDSYNQSKPITKVLVEYEYNPRYRIEADPTVFVTKLKLKDNQIIIKKVEEKMYSESEVIELMQKSITYGIHLEAGTIKINYKSDYKLDWIKQNLKQIT